MPGLKLVAHFCDGRVLKGATNNFDEAAAKILLTPADPPGAKPVEVELQQLKALFFVKDFAGNRSYKYEQAFRTGQPYAGKRMEVTFNDGETLVGSSPNYIRSLPGFFLFPADTNGNIVKLFAINKNVKSVRWL
jgi:hypothetical protein